MKIKNLVEKHQKLLKNDNFRNNQNYVLWNYLTAQIFNKYKKKNFIEKYKEKITQIIILLWFIFLMLGKILINFYLYFFWGFLVVFPTIFYGIYKIINISYIFNKYYLNKTRFCGERYIFRKKIRNKIYKNDYIIFKK